MPSGVTPSVIVDTNPYLSISPNPTGVNQYILVNFWITPPPSAQRFLAGFTVTFTKPDGTKDVVGPFNSYIADGTCWFNYVVDQIGDWTVKFDFSGEYFPAGYYLIGALMTNTSGNLTRQCTINPPQLLNRHSQYYLPKCYLGHQRNFQPTTGHAQ